MCSPSYDNEPYDWSSGDEGWDDTITDQESANLNTNETLTNNQK